MALAFFVFTDIFQKGGNLAWGGSADAVFVVAQGSMCFLFYLR